METIINYVDHMFASLPKTKQMLKLKEEILSNMEDKYHELKNSGRSENEAIGIVISEFGNMDELMEEFELEQASEGKLLPSLIEEEANAYLEVNKKSGMIIGIGVFMCILAPALLILITQLIKDGIIGGISERVSGIVGLIPLFILVTTAVVLFIYSGMKMEKFKYIEHGVELSIHVRTLLQQKYESFQSTYILSVIIGVVLCILSPITLIIISTISENSSVYGVVVLLLMVSVAVYIFVYFGTIKSGFRKLLNLDEYSANKKEENRVIGAVASIMWPLAVCIFLVSGLVYNMWHINWIVFPITGLLFSMFSGAYTILKGERS